MRQMKYAGLFEAIRIRRSGKSTCTPPPPPLPLFRLFRARLFSPSHVHVPSQPYSLGFPFRVDYESFAAKYRICLEKDVLKKCAAEKGRCGVRSATSVFVFLCFLLLLLSFPVVLCSFCLLFGLISAVYG